MRLYKLALFSQNLTLELGMGPHISATGVGWADAIHGLGNKNRRGCLMAFLEIGQEGSY